MTRTGFLMAAAMMALSAKSTTIQYTATTKIGTTLVYYSYTTYDNDDGNDYVKLGSFGSTKAVGTFDIAPAYNGVMTKVIGMSAFNGCTGITAITIPETVDDIENYAFASCYSLKDMTVPDGVTHLGAYSFAWCKELKSINIPHRIVTIWNDAFCGCTNLTEITVPANVTNICDEVFANCYSMTNIVFEGSMPTFGENVFYGIPDTCVITVKDPTGWDYYADNGLTPPWDGLTVVGLDSVEPTEPDEDEEEETDEKRIYLTVTNVVVHYVVTVPTSGMVAPVSGDVGIVNVISEVKGGNVAVPESWTNNYPTFAAKYGTDFSAALTKTTGKTVGGTAQMVWQDFVAGTDPTDESDVFTATITLVDGKPEIDYKPQLTDEEKAKRVYTTYGKEKLTDEWSVVDEGEEEKFNFFKVTVEMR